MPRKFATQQIITLAVAFVAGGALTALLFLSQPAAAEQDNCRMQDMTFNATSDQLGGPEVKIMYHIPMCMTMRGYTVGHVEKAYDRAVEVTYRK